MTDIQALISQMDAREEQQAKDAGQQKYPHSRIKVGTTLYRVDVDEWDDGRTSIAIIEWVVRSIRRKRGTQTPMGKRRVGKNYGDTAPVYVNVTAKIENVTWVRQSRKVADFGWSKSIPELFRRQFKVGSRLPLGIFTTELAALKWSLKEQQRMLERYKSLRDEEDDEDEIAEWNEDIAHKEKSIRLLKARITKYLATA